ncbi:MAG: carboxymuconolactone decarboxylase family protein [Alphaproteobacteria bacterium]|nr:carboxymuconolactone decarboxylase family protein [Alphaproteobacteria bacterium]
MYLDWQESLKQLAQPLRELRGGSSDVMKSFASLSQSALKTEALDTKTKELMALAIGVATRCDDCIGFHVKAALREGASRAEILETIGLAIYMGAGPSVMYAAHAIEAFDQMAAAQGKTGQTAA